MAGIQIDVDKSCSADIGARGGVGGLCLAT